MGSNLVDALVERGDDVTVLDDLSTGHRENLERALGHGARLSEVDIRDGPRLTDLFEREGPMVTFHLAAQIDVRRSVSDPGFDLAVNAGGTLNVLEAARAGGCPRVVLASTGGAIYGEGADRALPLDEDAALRPDAPYGQSKLSAEGYAALYARLHGLSTLSLRLGNVYGPRQDPLGEAGVAAIFCTTLLRGGTPKVFGDGQQTRDYVYVRDVVDAFLAAGESEVQGAYNIGTGVETTVLALGWQIAELCGREFEPEMAPPRPGEIARIALDASRARHDLGWFPRTDLTNGLRLTVEAARRS